MNVINDNWLFVEYLDGHKEQISIRKAFIDADKIKDIDTPIFHDSKVFIYDVPIILFLVTILEAAYFKPEYRFKSGKKNFSKELMKNGWDKNILNTYFDKWENRFNLFDEKYPFLQEIKLKEIENSKNDYISKLSPIAPAGNNLIFENSSNTPIENLIDKYDFDITELIYVLLYTNAMGVSPMPAKYPNKSLMANATMYIIPKGKNLKETIIYNCLPLIYSARPNIEEPDIKYDRPIWELDSKDEILEYDMANISDNILLCSFFPSILLYVDFKDNKIENIIISKNSEDCILDKKSREALSTAYVTKNPWTIMSSIVEKDVTTIKYKEWNKSLKIISLCISITKKLMSGNIHCNIINTTLQENHDAICEIYYREFDKYKCNVYSIGKYIVPQYVFDILQDDENYIIAENFESIISDIQRYIKAFKGSGISSKIVDSWNLQFSQFAENYFLGDFIKNINAPIKNSVDILTKQAKQIIDNSINSIRNPLQYVSAYRLFNNNIKKLIDKFKEETNE